MVNPTSCSSSPPSLLGTSAMAAAASLSDSRPRNPFRLPPPPPTMPSGAAGELFSIRTCFKFLFAAIFRTRSFLAGLLRGRGARCSNHRLRPSANSKWRRRQPRRVVTSLRKAPPTVARAAFPATAPACCWTRGTGTRMRCRARAWGGRVRPWRVAAVGRCCSLPAPASQAKLLQTARDRSLRLQRQTRTSGLRCLRGSAAQKLPASSAPSQADPPARGAAPSATILG